MGQFILRRIGLMLITSICLTFIVFFLTNLFPNLEKLAKKFKDIKNKKVTPPNLGGPASYGPQ